MVRWKILLKMMSFFIKWIFIDLINEINNATADERKILEKRLDEINTRFEIKELWVENIEKFKFLSLFSVREDLDDQSKTSEENDGWLDEVEEAASTDFEGAADMEVSWFYRMDKKLFELTLDGWNVHEKTIISSWFVWLSRWTWRWERWKWT